jgi:hypothetical protein
MFRFGFKTLFLFTLIILPLVVDGRSKDNEKSETKILGLSLENFIIIVIFLLIILLIFLGWLYSGVGELRLFSISQRSSVNSRTIQSGDWENRSSYGQPNNPNSIVVRSSRWTHIHISIYTHAHTECDRNQKQTQKKKHRHRQAQTVTY